MNLRGQLASNLRAALGPGVKVLGYPTQVGKPTKKTLCVWAETVEPDLAGTYAVSLKVQAFVPEQLTPGPGADNRLDDLLGEVLDVVWSQTWLIFERAERTTNEERTLNSWTISVRAILTATKEASTA